MIKLHFSERNNIFFSKDRSVSRDLSFQPVKTRQYKRNKTKETKQNKTNKTKETKQNKRNNTTQNKTKETNKK